MAKAKYIAVLYDSGDNVVSVVRGEVEAKNEFECDNKVIRKHLEDPEVCAVESYSSFEEDRPAKWQCDDEQLLEHMRGLRSVREQNSWEVWDQMRLKKRVPTPFKDVPNRINLALTEFDYELVMAGLEVLKNHTTFDVNDVQDRLQEQYENHDFDKYGNVIG